MQEINSKSTDKKKLMRVYECKECKKYHLTSMTRKKYNNTKDPDSRTKVREQRFIQTEAEYYSKKFNL